MDCTRYNIILQSRQLLVTVFKSLIFNSFPQCLHAQIMNTNCFSYYINFITLITKLFILVEHKYKNKIQIQIEQLQKNYRRPHKCYTEIGSSHFRVYKNLILLIIY